MSVAGNCFQGVRVDCPACGEAMSAGIIEIHAPRFSFLVFGLSAPRHLFWVADEDDSTELVLQAGEGAPGHLCMRCGTLVVPPQRA